MPEPDNKKLKKSSMRWSPRALPTMDDVARVTGFSQMTVSRAFLQSAPIKEETRKRILKAATKIGYYHNKAASSLASQRTRTFGIILPTLQDSIYVPFVDAARHVFEDQGFDHLLQTIDYTRGREMHAIGSLLSHRVRAILLPSIGHTPDTRKLLQTLPIPLIEVGNLPNHPVHYAVGHSDADAGYSLPKDCSMPGDATSPSFAASPAKPQMPAAAYEAILRHWKKPDSKLIPSCRPRWSIQSNLASPVLRGCCR